jgi:hypothetical protein
MGGSDINQYIGEEDIRVNTTLTSVPRNEANLEAEGGETAYGDINGDGFPEHHKIEGPRHTNGGVPLNLPDNTFIFSDTASMRIKDPDTLAQFGKSTGSYTPAQLAKQYDLNKYRKILQDPNSDALDKKTAELMIRNYNMKLGALAIAQESKKGFPQGVPFVSQPFMEANGITEEDILPTYQRKFSQQPEGEEMEMQEAPEQMPEEGYTGPNPEDIAMAENMPMARFGMSMNDYSLPYAQEGIVINPYEGGKTEAGTTTPTGQSNKFSNRKQEIAEYLKQWEEAIPGISKMTEGQAQAAIYDWNLANNPDAIKNMWKTYGLTAKGMKNANLKKLSKEGQFDDEALKDPEVLKALKDAYVDNYFGVRQLDPVKKGETPKTPDTPQEPQKIKTCKCVSKSGASYDPGKDDKGNCIPCKKTERPEIEELEVPPAQQVVSPEWMTPDKLNYYGALQDMYSINNYFPWAAPVDLEEVKGVYLDPTRQLAANSEQANIISQGMAQFAGPQQYSSRSSAIQGQGAKGAADILSAINNANVQIANTTAGQNAQIRNNERLQNQAIAKQLYDQTTKTLAERDAQNMAARGIKRQAFATGWKNASDLALVNATSEQYDIDPVTGTVVFTGGKPIQPDNAKTFDSILQSYIQQGFEPKDAIAAAKIAMGQGSNYTGPDVDAILANAKKGIIVTGPMFYPFVL